MTPLSTKTSMSQKHHLEKTACYSLKVTGHESVSMGSCFCSAMQKGGGGKGGSGKLWVQIPALPSLTHAFGKLFNFPQALISHL